MAPPNQSCEFSHHLDSSRDLAAVYSPAPSVRATGTVLMYYVMCHTLTGQYDTCTVMIKGFLGCNGSTKATTESVKYKYNKGDVNGGTKMGGSRQQGGTS